MHANRLGMLCCLAAATILLRDALCEDDKKIRIAVLPFTASATARFDPHEREDIGQAFTDKIKTAISSLGRFRVIERGEGLERLLSEHALMQSGATDQPADSLAAAISSIDLAVIGSVNMISISSEVNDKGARTYTAGVSQSIRFTDPSTGEIKEARDVVVTGSGNSRTDARFAAIANTAAKVVAIVRELFPLESEVFQVSGNTVFLRIGADRGARRGMRFETYRAADPIIDPSTGDTLGMERTVSGLVKVFEVQPKMSKATILKNKATIRTGDHIREVKVKTRVALSLGWGFAGLSTTRNANPADILYRTGIGEWDTLSPDVSDFDEPTLSNGLAVALEFISIKGSKVSLGLGLDILGTSTITGFLFDARLSYDLPVVLDRLSIPLGAGFLAGSYTYRIDYAKHLHAVFVSDNDYNYMRPGESTAQDGISGGVIGGVPFAGIRLAVHKHVLITAAAGYRLCTPILDWDITYTKQQWNNETWENENVEDSFTADSDYLPYSEINPSGFDARLLVSAVF